MLAIVHMVSRWVERAFNTQSENFNDFLTTSCCITALFIYYDIGPEADNVKHHMNLQYIPAEQRGMWQPLDAFIFGELKSRAKFNKRVAEFGPADEKIVMY